jgi:hypothetical protein
MSSGETRTVTDPAAALASGEARTAEESAAARADAEAGTAEPGVTGAEAAVRVLDEACTAIEGLPADQLEAVPPQAIQRLVARAVKLYVAKRESGCDFEPIADGDLSATEVSATASGLLKVVRMEPFELGWWSRFGKL